MSATMGRPRSANPRSHAVPIRLSDTELDAIRAAAAVAGVRVGEWARAQLLRAAAAPGTVTPSGI